MASTPAILNAKMAVALLEVWKQDCDATFVEISKQHKHLDNIIKTALMPHVNSRYLTTSYLTVKPVTKLTVYILSFKVTT